MAAGELGRRDIERPDVNGSRIDRAAGDLGIDDSYAGAGGEEQGGAKREEEVFHKGDDEVRSCDNADCVP